MNPKDVFDRFLDHIEYFCAADDTRVEDQHFDRKEACRRGTDTTKFKEDLGRLREHLKETVSAFTNTNSDGGLLVLGISNKGEIKGVDHLTEQECNSLTDLDSLLRGHLAQCRIVNVTHAAGKHSRLILIYAAYSPSSICETLDRRPKAWRRSGRQNTLMSDDQKDEIRREKHIIDFERRLACPFESALLDPGLMQVAREAWGVRNASVLPDQDLLYQKGAVEKDAGKYFLTNAGLLFFAANPQRVLTTAYVRLLRFDIDIADAASPRNPTLDKLFGGPIAKQIQDLRTYLNESALLRRFAKRTQDGTFVEECEYPPAALDEAIVNAIIHRDYGANWSVECRYFADAFEVRNPGRMLQRNAGVPDQFLLSQVQLDHYARNGKLFEWLKDIRDFRGSPFVLGVAEGTRNMRRTMSDLKLPSPEYRVAESETILTLRNDIRHRVAEIEAPASSQPLQHSNLYPLFRRDARGSVIRIRRDERRAFLCLLRARLLASGWYVDSLRFGRLVAHLQGGHIPAPTEAVRVVRLYPAYSFSISECADRELLCVDYELEVKNVSSARVLLSHFKSSDLVGRTGTASLPGWERCRILAVDQEWATVRLLEYDKVEKVQTRLVIPDLPTRMLKKLLEAEGVAYDLEKAIRLHSLSSVPNASRVRSEKTQSAVEEISRSVFPLVVGDEQAVLGTTPVALSQRPSHVDALPLALLNEPAVEFADHRATPDIRDGITRFGSFDATPRQIELVPVVLQAHRRQMQDLIARLQVGKFKYRGAERTFATRFSYQAIVTTETPEGAVLECQRLIKSHPDWVGNSNLDRVFLVHAPEEGFAQDDEGSPYYRLKRVLLESGMPCQMVDTPTLDNPDFKDLNLALNIASKCGIIPWVLPHAIPDADFFVGLSYTENRARGGERLMGYANVFNEFGRWQFYSGNTNTFAYEEKPLHLGSLVRETLSRLSISEMPNVYFHYTARFSREDRDAILRAARSVRQKGTYTFVWINSHHRLRLYDNQAEGDGSIARGSFVVTGPSRVYVSTTGHNPYRRLLGTPVVLEINVHRDLPRELSRSPIDLRAISAQVLALTKLNWASSDALCAEPITTKYAGDIAKLTAAFMRQQEAFRLHPRLEHTPWFI